MRYTLSFSEYPNFPQSGEYSKSSMADFYTDPNTGETVETPHGYCIDNNGSLIKLEKITHHYDIDVTKTQITVNGRTMPIKEDREFSYKLQKTQIKSRDLPDFFSDYGKNINGDDLTKSFWRVYYNQICAHVVKYGKQVV